MLGLLVEQPDNGYQLERRLEAGFPSMQFTRGTAYHALERLAKNGLVRPVDGEDAALAEDAKLDRGTRYEITASGVRCFKAWIRSSIALPIVREDLLAKIALCTPEDLPAMIETVRDAEMSCTAKLNAENRQVRQERERADPEDWGKLIEVIVMSGHSGWWDERIKWLQKVREDMEDALRRYRSQWASVPPSPESR
ncbi:MAG: PadR family transcriptional regulator [Solirubrobacterales bacterium]